jgi:hypothetical protein
MQKRWENRALYLMFDTTTRFDAAVQENVHSLTNMPFRACGLIPSYLVIGRDSAVVGIQIGSEVSRRAPVWHGRAAREVPECGTRGDLDRKFQH